VIQSFRPWLPATALRADQLESRLSQAIDEWSHKWFARRPMRLVGASSGDVIDGEWQALDEGLGLSVTPNGPSAIAAALLDLSADEKLSAPADDAVVERLARTCVEDLKDRLCGLLGLPVDSLWLGESFPGAGVAGATFWSIGTDGEPSALCLRADPELLVRLAKRGVATPAERLDLRPLREGLVRQPVALSAFLGGCELTLSEVASLAPGDVLVLDQAVGDPLELSVHPADRSGRCVVEHDGEALCLKIVRPFFE
jgi:hypothetical protein